MCYNRSIGCRGKGTVDRMDFLRISDRAAGFLIFSASIFGLSRFSWLRALGFLMFALLLLISELSRRDAEREEDKRRAERRRKAGRRRVGGRSRRRVLPPASGRAGERASAFSSEKRRTA